MRTSERLGIVIAVVLAVATAIVFASSAPARFPGAIHQDCLARIAHWPH